MPDRPSPGERFLEHFHGPIGMRGTRPEIAKWIDHEVAKSNRVATRDALRWALRYANGYSDEIGTNTVGLCFRGNQECWEAGHRTREDCLAFVMGVYETVLAQIEAGQEADQ